MIPPSGGGDADAELGEVRDLGLSEDVFSSSVPEEAPGDGNAPEEQAAVDQAVGADAPDATAEEPAAPAADAPDATAAEPDATAAPDEPVPAEDPAVAADQPDSPDDQTA